MKNKSYFCSEPYSAQKLKGKKQENYVVTRNSSRRYQI